MNPYADPEALMRVEPLSLRARIVVEGFLSGLHRSPWHGTSVEFREYRPYTQGDDPRHLDWKLLARTDRRFVKRFEDETNLRCRLLVDLSRSMAYGRERAPKADYAITLAATLARFLVGQRDAVGLTTFDEGVRENVPARGGAGQLHRLFATLERATAGASTGLVDALDGVARTSRRRGMVILLSDLLTSVDGLERAFGRIRARGQELVVVRVIDPSEVEFPFEEASIFEDLESGRRVYVDPRLSRDEYRRRFDEHDAALERAAAHQAVQLVRWTTDRPLAEFLFEFVQARARMRTGGARRSPVGGRP